MAKAKEMSVMVAVPTLDDEVQASLTFEGIQDPRSGFGKLEKSGQTDARITVRRRDQVAFDVIRLNITGVLRFSAGSGEQAVELLGRYEALRVGARSGGETHWLTFSQ